MYSCKLLNAFNHYSQSIRKMLYLSGKIRYLPKNTHRGHLDCNRTDMRSFEFQNAELEHQMLIMCLHVQNGALAEAIRIWKSNFDKEFEGVEECPICYSVIHTANHSLPRLACKTCKHKFHAACLYKWFSTSHKSTCPLCQSPF